MKNAAVKELLMAYLQTKEGLLLLASIAAILLNAVIYIGVVLPQDAEVSLIKFRKSHGAASSAADPFLKAKRVKEDLSAFRKTLPVEKDLTKSLSAVLSSASKSGLRVAKGTYSPETVRSAGVSRYTIVFPVEGGYEQVKRFVGLVEAMDTPVVVEDIVFSKGASGTVGINIKLSLYYI